MTTDKREAIYEIADQLLRKGVKPTQQHIRDALGSGSLTTINRALNEWWQSLGDRLDAQAKGYDLPDPVIKHASRMWNDALIYAQKGADSTYQAIESELQETLQKLDKVDAKYARQIVDLNGFLEATNTENRALKADIKTLEDALKDEREQAFKLSKELTNLNQQVDKNKLDPAVNNEVLLEAQVRLKIQKEEITRMREEIQRLSSENALLTLKLETSDR